MEATLSLWSAVLSPEQISELVGTEPDHAVVMGKLRSPPRVMPKANGWHMICSDPDAVLIEDIVEMLLKKSHGVIGKLDRVLAADKNLEVKVYVICWKRKLRELAYFLPPEIIKQISAIGASFDLAFEDTKV